MNEDLRVKTGNEPEEHELDGDIVQLTDNLQSYENDQLLKKAPAWPETVIERSSKAREILEELKTWWKKAVNIWTTKPKRS